MARSSARRKIKPLIPGYDGAEEFKADVRLSLSRVEERTIRCRPGTFEWRYGRKSKDGALYHAGVHFAGLYERAGTASASSPDLSQSGIGGSWKGLPDSRVSALDAIRPINEKLGVEPRLRLIAYCVEGATVSELAILAGVPDRDMAAVIHQDMTALAKITKDL